MGKGLEGKRIVIAGSRKTDEMSMLIEKQGGTPIVRSLQGTTFLADKQVEPDLRRFVQEGADWVVFTTGIGTETLLDLAGKMGIQDQFLMAIRQAKVAARGYKTYAALKKMGVKPVAVDEDGTTRGLVRSLEAFDFSNQWVIVQLHGKSEPAFIKFFEDKGASVLQLLPYQHIAPESEVAESLCQELIHNQLDAVCFTTAVQVRYLFEFAREHGYLDDVLNAFKHEVLAVSVGKVTTDALREEGIERVIAPEIERMGAMIVELSRYYEDHLQD